MGASWDNFDGVVELAYPKVMLATSPSPVRYRTNVTLTWSHARARSLLEPAVALLRTIGGDDSTVR
jgi:hypothetical protein